MGLTAVFLVQSNSPPHPPKNKGLGVVLNCAIIEKLRFLKTTTLTGRNQSEKRALIYRAKEEKEKRAKKLFTRLACVCM